MATSDSAEQLARPRRNLGQWAKQAGLFVLFGTILVIPRIRRLRRRAWAWSAVRLGLAACATGLGWRYKNAGAGTPTLVFSLILFAFALLVRAKPEEKSVDALARELRALIVLNGGAFRTSPEAVPVAPAQLFVRADKILVVGRREQVLLEIPFAAVHRLAAHPVSAEARTAELWEVAVTWQDDPPCTATFEYDGPFAEHLARVTESTLRSQWVKDLPVLGQ